MAAIIHHKKPIVSLSVWLARARWRAEWLLRRLGAPLVLAIAATLLAALCYWHTQQMRQQQAQLTRQWQVAMQKRNEASQAKPQVDPASADLARQVAQFYAFLPSHDALPDQIKRLLASADKHGLQLQQGEYKAQAQANTSMLRYQIVLPVKADYPKIASFLQSALQEMPSLTLESMQIKRSSIEAVEVEARLQLALLVRVKESREANKNKSAAVPHE